MKILIADAFSAAHLDALRALGLAVDYQPGLGADTLAAAMSGVGILVVRSTEVRAATIEGAPDLALIIRAGAGVNTIDVKRASAHGVFVANCPGRNSIAVAELTMGLLIAIDRRIPDQVAELRAGAWNKQEYSKAKGLKGASLGLVGFGAIACEVASRAQAFGMTVRAWSRSLTDEIAREHGVERAATLEELAASVDALSVHLPLKAETRGLIGAKVFARMKPGAIFLNTARGEVVDGVALEAAVAGRKLRVGLDVFSREPGGGTGGFEDPIVTLPGVYGTHHVGASTEQAQSAIAEETVRIVRAFVEHGEVLGCVNVPGPTPAACQLLVRHYDRVGVLAEVLGAIRRHGINVAEMDNTIFTGADAACARIRLSELPPDALVDEVRRSSPDILQVSLVK